MMKITVVRSGGFAGLTRSWVIIIDQRDEAWTGLLDDLPWRQVTPSAPQPDRYVYRIRVSRRQVVLPEQELSGAWRTLVDRVVTQAEGEQAERERAEREQSERDQTEREQTEGEQTEREQAQTRVTSASD